MIPFYPFLLLSFILLAAGLLVVITRKHILGICLGVEVIFLAASMNWLVLSQRVRETIPRMEGEALCFLIVGLAAARLSIAVLLSFIVYRNTQTADAENLMTLKG